MSGAHIAIHAAKKRQEKSHKEEESMSGYGQEDLAQGWEFKIIRAGSRQFHKPDVLAAVLEEEALAGWELVEKFDDQRIRFKRSVSARSRDGLLPAGFDPYRTQYGISEEQIGIAIALVAFALVAIGIGFALLTGSF
jgi:hypothetical protein